MQVKTSYERAIVRKYPEQVVIAVVKDSKGKYNPIALGWSMITSGSPPMMAISVAPGRYSCGAIRAAKEFVVSFPSEAMAKEALFYGTKSGRDTDKLAVCGTRTQPAAEIDCVLLADAVANFECKLAAELVTGDHVLFVGEVVAAHMNEDAAQRRLYTVGPGHEMGGAVAR